MICQVAVLGRYFVGRTLNFDKSCLKYAEKFLMRMEKRTFAHLKMNRAGLEAQ